MLMNWDHPSKMAMIDSLYLIKYLLDIKFIIWKRYFKSIHAKMTPVIALYNQVFIRYQGNSK